MRAACRGRSRTWRARWETRFMVDGGKKSAPHQARGTGDAYFFSVSSSSKNFNSCGSSSVFSFLGATGAVELAFCLLALRDGRVPPTLHLKEPETDLLDFVPGAARNARIRRAASLSFGFGGALAAVAVEKLP